MPLKEMLNRSGRRTIALLTNVTNTYYDYMLFRYIHQAALSHNTNLVTFNCGSLDTTLSHYYEYQNNLMYNFPCTDLVDGLIFIPSMITNYSTRLRYQHILDKLSRTPYITLSTGCKGHPGVFVDNSSGFREVINYLYHTQGKHLFAFISGPSNNSESAERLKGYLDGLNDCGIKQDDRYIFQGDFWLTGGHAAMKELDRRNIPCPEVIICSNDYTAFAVYKELSARKLKIPDDVQVVGFDNIEDSQFCNPPLTTVKLPLEQMAQKTVELLLQIIDGKEVPEKTYLPTRVIYRQSTGFCSYNQPQKYKYDSLLIVLEPRCRDHALKWLETLPFSKRDQQLSAFVDILQKTLDEGLNVSIWEDFPMIVMNYCVQADALLVDSLRLYISMYSGLQQGMKLTQNRYSTQIIAQVVHRIISTFSLEEMQQYINEEITKLGIHHFFMVAYPEPFERTITSNKSFPPKSRYLFGFVNGKKIDRKESSKIFNTIDLIPPDIELPDEPLSLIIVASFFRETQLGFMIFDASSNEEQVYTVLGMQISTAYRSILIFNEKEKNERELESALSQLKKSNRKLNALAVCDPLTGLANRRGFLLLGQKIFEVMSRRRKGILVFFGDIDRLKSINDTYGHEAGDLAIKLCAEVFKKTFRKSDVIARIAGDEFTIIAVEPKKNDVQLIEDRLKENMSALNKSSGFLWQISISMGHVLSSDFPELSFTELLAKADLLQYEQKKRKHSTQNMVS